MSTENLPPEVLADSEAVMEHVIHGNPLSPETYQRIRGRADRVTEELRRKFGEMDIAVQLIRETRDE